MSGARILIIDPSEKIRRLLAAHLTSRGYQVDEVEHGVAAARRMRAPPPDLILIDQDVPLGGVRTARILRLHPAFQLLPILLMANQPLAGQALAAGKRLHLDRFLVKPCTGPALEAMIQEGLRKRLDKVSVQTLREELAQLSDLPVLLPNHRKMLSLLAREDGEVDIPELIRTIETDPGLTTRILRISHAVYYGFRGNTIASATTFLGIDKIRKIAQASILFDLFQSERGAEEKEGFSLLELWRHSVACGLIMEEGGHRVKGRDHFIAGMLHDVGKVVLYLRFREHFEEIARLAREEEMSMYRAEQEVMGITHTDIGHELARKWELPPTIAAAIAFHHRPSAALQHRRLASLVHLSDLLTRQLQIGHGGDRQAIRIDPLAQPLAQHVFAVAEKKAQIAAEVESVVGEGMHPAGTEAPQGGTA